MTTPTTNAYLKTSRRGRGMPAYVSGQSPIRTPDTTNLGLWLDASQISASHGDALGTWSDMSGNARHASQGTGSLQPVYITNSSNNRPGVLFANSSSRSAMTITMTTPAWGTTVGTYYGVLFFGNNTINAATPFGWSNRNDEYWWYAANTSYIGMMRSARLEAASIAFTIGWHVITVLSGATAYNVYDNGATLYSGSSAWAGPTTGFLGDNSANNGGAFWRGCMNEILIYNAEHTAEQMQSVWNYLKWKWAVG